MPRARSTQTKDRIRAASLELFRERGVQQTSMRDIADRVGITKPALYYHFASREDLLRSLVRPMLDDYEAAVAADEAAGGAVDPRVLLARYFDVSMRHREVNRVVFRDAATLAELDLGGRVLDWRRRITAMLAGPGAELAELARVTLVLGGLGDCVVLLGDRPAAELRAAALAAAYTALGLPPGPPPVTTGVPDAPEGTTPEGDRT
ncbi:TetR/AcrR family transcriptional regulator [Nocardiopsis changdeensis]|uniref:TetR/AcrR family transcriptional regulator n=1 Tax=Nocardiopsis changdeensis TaxID=2831969 RepID=UPI003F486ED7